MITEDLFIPDLDLATEALNRFSSPLFLSDAATIRDRLHKFHQNFPANTGIFYAVKANYNPHILRLLRLPGADMRGVDGVDTVSPFEVDLALQQGFSKEQIIFTGNNASTEELQRLAAKGITLNLGSMCELERYAQLVPMATKVSLRFNPGIGAGEFKGTTTGGEGSKFGLLPEDLKRACSLIAAKGLQLVGIHCHIGSGFYESESFAKAAAAIIDACKKLHLKNLDFVDFGGGFGVRYRPHEKAIQLSEFAAKLKPLLEDFQSFNGKESQIRLEPGKFLVAESTVLLTRVTSLKNEGETLWVGTDSGFNHLVRPAFYGAYHHIINLSRQEDVRLCAVVGNICESSDIFNKKSLMAKPQLGDILAVLSSGAYGAAMSSLYNLRPYAAEALHDNGQLKQTRNQLSFAATLASLGFVS